MTWQVVRLEDVFATPWRNGGGVTRELAAWPQAADWTWRMSVAEVGQSGAFSIFDGVDRWFAVLAGSGVQLMVDKKPIAGVIGAPAYPSKDKDRDGVLFHAQSGVAYRQPLSGGQVKRMRVSNRTEIAELRALESVEKSHANHERMARVVGRISL